MQHGEKRNAFLRTFIYEQDYQFAPDKGQVHFFHQKQARN